MKPQTIPEGWDIEIWGYPWHGKVTGTTLTLPNTATMPIPEPAWGPLSRWWAGAVWVQQRQGKGPNLSKIIRPAPGGTNDATAGRTWLNYITLSGLNHLFYGKELGDKSWLWEDAAGEVWKVTAIPDPAVPGQPMTASVYIDRFGVLGAPTESYRHDVSLANHGVTGIQVPPGVAYGAPQFEDVTRSGHKAMFSLVFNPYYSGTHLYYVAQSAMGGKALGFIEFELSGTGASASVQMRVLRTQAQVISGSSVAVSPLNYDTYYLSIDRQEVHKSSCAVVGSGGTYDVDVTYTAQWSTTQGGTSPVDVTSASWSEYVRHIVGMYYDDNGNAQEVVFEFSESGTENSPIPSGGGAQTVTMTATCPGPSLSPEPVTTFTFTRLAVATVSGYYRLTRGGSVVSHETFSCTNSLDQSTTISYGAAAPGQTYSSNLVHSLTTSQWGTLGWSDSSSGAGGQYFGTPVIRGLRFARLNDPRSLHPLRLAAYGDATSCYVEPHRWAAYLWGTRATAYTVPFEGSLQPPAGTVMTWQYSNAVGRWASAAGVSLQNPSGEIEYRFGAEDPVTATAQIASRTPFGYV